MAKTKYGKYLIREPSLKIWPAAPIGLDSSFNEGITCNMAFSYRSEPGWNDIQPHKHDADEYLLFFGGDPTNILDFQAEVELCLGHGQDQEKFIINTATIVYVPKGLVHLPWDFKRVDKPILVGHIQLSPNWSKKSPE